MTGATVTLAIDAHLHLYPWYDLERSLSCLQQGLLRLGGPGAQPVGCLAERHDCQAYATIRDQGRVGSYAVRNAGTHLLLDGRHGGSLALLPGRQVVTAERLEVLALGCDGRFEDGTPVAALVPRILDAGAVPVLAWAPGKWMFKRRPIVEALLERFGGHGLVLGDSPLRAIGWPVPRLMRRGASVGCGVVAGSDPLPLTGEEPSCGSYATCVLAGDETDLAACVLAGCRDSRLADAVGRRNGPLTMLLRLFRNARSKR